MASRPSFFHRAPFRWAGEFLLIVVGVVVALAADSWRESRTESTRARAAVALLIVDLASDSVEFSQILARIPEHETAFARVLTTSADAPLPPDSALAWLSTLASRTQVSPTRSVYESLIQTDGLRHVGDLELQAEVNRYYQVAQPDVITTFEAYLAEYDDFLEARDRHLAYAASSEAEAVATLGLPILRTSWAAMRSDDELLSALRQTMGWERILGELARGALGRNVELRRRLELLQ